MNNLSQIKHIVYLMLENRSLDNVLGWLYDEENPTNIITKSGDNHKYHGLQQGRDVNYYTNDPTPHYVKKGTKMMDSPENDPNESFSYVTNQLFNKGRDYVPGQEETPKMSGFLNDFTTAEKWIKILDGVAPIPGTKIGKGDEALQIMDSYTKEELPVLYGLAKNFAISDMWFSSIPSQTNCNRAFSICGNSLGYTDNKEGDRFPTPTIWNILADNGHSSQFDFMVFHQTNDLMSSYSYTRRKFPYTPEENFAPYSAFLNALDNNMLPKYSYLEPAWLRGPTGNGNSYHPPGEVGPGELFVKELYDKLINSECWDETLFIITFDEHGGTYDHVPPPHNVTPPDRFLNTFNPPNDPFSFDRFGVRVPTILISPWVDSGTVFRSTEKFEYDHTSFIATILNWFGVTDKSKWNSLGERVKVAPVFDKVVNRSTPRTDKPKIQTGPISDNIKPPSELPVSGLQEMMLPGFIQHVSSKSISDQEADEMAKVIISKSNTLENLHDHLIKLKNDNQATTLSDHSIIVDKDFYAITGKVIDAKDNSPVYLAQVQALDKDMIGEDDELGSTHTNSKGEFVISFDKSKFGSIFIDRKPDIYFHVLVDDQLVVNTSKNAIKNASESKDPIILQINKN